MELEAYFDASVATEKGVERLGRWRTGFERKSCFRESKAD